MQYQVFLTNFAGGSRGKEADFAHCNVIYKSLRKKIRVTVFASLSGVLVKAGANRHSVRHRTLLLLE